MYGIYLIALLFLISVDGVPPCPDDEPDTEHLIIRDVQDCNSFYICGNGISHHITCPVGLQFNPNINVCDWPDNVGCTNKTAESTIVMQPEPESCDHVTDDRLLADLEDCNRYITCANGREISMRCPHGLHFNVSGQACDWPHLAGCALYEDDVTTPEPSCGPHREGSLIPDEENCQRYYVCTNGEYIAKICPNHTHFSQQRQRCEWPHLAGCQQTDMEESTTSVANTTYNVCDDASFIKTLMPDPENCSKFYICTNGQAVSMNCPPGLQFNYEEQICDWPGGSGCEE